MWNELLSMKQNDYLRTITKLLMLIAIKQGITEEEIESFLKEEE